MRRPSYESATVYQCAGAQTADISGQAGGYGASSLCLFLGGLTADGTLRGAQCLEGSRSVTEMLRRSSARHRETYCGEGCSAMCHGLDLVTARFGGTGVTGHLLTSLSLSDGPSDPYCLPVFSSQLFRSVTNLIIVCSQTWHK
jgi:hypothetical protein